MRGTSKVLTHTHTHTHRQTEIHTHTYTHTDIHTYSSDTHTHIQYTHTLTYTHTYILIYTPVHTARWRTGREMKRVTAEKGLRMASTEISARGGGGNKQPGERQQKK